MVYLIEDADRHICTTVAFDTPMACFRYIQRFGEPGWRPKPVNMLDLDEVRALPSNVAELVG